MIYKCIKPCIAKNYDHSTRVQVQAGDKYKLGKQVRNTVTLTNTKRTIHITSEQLKNNFIKA